MKNTKIIVITALCIMLCGCSNSKASNISDINTDTLKEQTEQFLSGNNTSELNMFNEGVVLDTDDACNTKKENWNQCYLSNNAFYVQTDTYMYRFQFDSNNKIASYIKYTLEG